LPRGAFSRCDGSGPVRLALGLFRRSDALHPLYRADPVSLDVLFPDTGYTHPELLDQHGRPGDHDAFRPALDPRRPSLAASFRDPAVPEGIHTLLLGCRRLVDPPSRHRGRLAARRAAGSAAIPPAVLVARVSAGHVHRRDLSARP